MTRTTRRIAFALVVTAVSLLVTEAALALIDPLGMWRYYNDLRGVRASFRPDAARVFVAEPGVYRMSNWTFTIDADGTRHTPASRADAPCTVVALGDSVTFGMGVNDAETWPNLYAEATGCRVVNAALPGYDIWAVYAAYRAHPYADRYVYLLIENDAAHDAERLADVPPGASALRVYVWLMQTGRQDVQDVPVPDDFWRVYDALAADERVTIVGFRDGGLAEQVAASQRRIALLAPYTSRVSWADAHPDAAGQAEIAGQIVEVERWD